LSRFKSLFVIARNSSFTYKGKAVDAVTVNQHLVFAENRQGMHRRMASRQGGHASPWRHRKGLC
jgi:adenylate cyclase